LFETLAGHIFSHLAERLVTAFEQRAAQLHGRRWRAAVSGNNANTETQ
jgi:hypothetical protein